MTFEEINDMFKLNQIDADLTCQCDETLNFVCQQCEESGDKDFDALLEYFERQQ